MQQQFLPQLVSHFLKSKPDENKTDKSLANAVRSVGLAHIQKLHSGGLDPRTSPYMRFRTRA
jgi:hypothetical protein